MWDRTAEFLAFAWEVRDDIGRSVGFLRWTLLTNIWSRGSASFFLER